MTTYTDIEAFLAQLAHGVESGQYTKATFSKALDEQVWAQVVADLSNGGAAIEAPYIAPFQFIGVLPTKPTGSVYTYDDLSKGIVSRLELIAFAKAHIKDFTAVRH